MRRTDNVLWIVFAVALMVSAGGVIAMFHVMQSMPSGVSGPRPPSAAFAEFDRLIRYGWVVNASLLVVAATAVALAARAYQRPSRTRGFPMTGARLPFDPPADPA